MKLVIFLDLLHVVMAALTDAFRETWRRLDNLRLLTKLRVVEFRCFRFARETSLRFSLYNFRLNAKIRVTQLVRIFLTAA